MVRSEARVVVTPVLYVKESGIGVDEADVGVACTLVSSFQDLL